MSERRMNEQSAEPGSGAMLTGPVIVGYDADPSSLDALVLGLGLGTALDLPVIVAKVHAAPAPIGAGRVDAEWVADRRHASAAVLTGAREEVAGLRPDPDSAASPVSYRLVPSSSAARGLSALAAQESGSVIVVGSAGAEGSARRVFAGSTAGRLLSGAEHPVVVAPKGLAGTGWNGLHTIGVAYLATGEGQVALELAADVARRTGAALHLFTAMAPEASVVPWLVGVDGEKAFSATAREGFQRSLDQAAATLRGGGGADGGGRADGGLDVSTSLLVGDVVGLLAELPGIDLLFCGSRGYGPVRRVLLGGVSTRLMRRADSPLVVVPRPA
jgi:nucleotide-binding universal stress UspA family protein